MGGNSPTEQVTTQDQTSTASGTTTPTMPEWANRYAKNTANLGSTAANSWANAGIDPTQIAGFNPDQAGAMGDVRGFGQSSPYRTALGQMQGTAGGDFLYGGAAQDAFINASMRSAMPGIMSSWGSANRSGGQLGKLQLAQVAGDSYAGLYNNERDRMMAASSALPGMAQLPIEMQMGIGGMQQQNEQAGYDAAKMAQDQARARDAAVAAYGAGSIPWAGLTGQKTTGTSTGTGTTTVPLTSNPMAGLLGGAVGGGQLGMTVGGPVGAGVGALGGGLLGYFG